MRITTRYFSLILMSWLVVPIVMACPPGGACKSNKLPSALSLDVVALTNQLNLSTEQALQIKSILSDITTPMAAYRDKMAEVNEQIEQLNKAQPLDTQAIQTLAEKQAQILTRVLAMRSQVRADIEAVLTPEQRQQIQQSHAQR